MCTSRFKHSQEGSSTQTQRFEEPEMAPHVRKKKKKGKLSQLEARYFSDITRKHMNTTFVFHFYMVFLKGATKL